MAGWDCGEAGDWLVTTPLLIAGGGIAHLCGGIGVRGFYSDRDDFAAIRLGDGNGGPTPEEVFAVPALRNTPAAANRSLIVLDGPYMLGFGPRTAGAIRDLTMALYPEYLAAGE